MYACSNTCCSTFTLWIQVTGICFVMLVTCAMYMYVATMQVSCSNEPRKDKLTMTRERQCSCGVIEKVGDRIIKQGKARWLRHWVSQTVKEEWAVDKLAAEMALRELADQIIHRHEVRTKGRLESDNHGQKLANKTERSQAKNGKCQSQRLSNERSGTKDWYGYSHRDKLQWKAVEQERV